MQCNSSREIVKLRNCVTDLLVPLLTTANGQESFSYRGAHGKTSFEPEVKQGPSLYVFIGRFECIYFYLVLALKFGDLLLL